MNHLPQWSFLDLQSKQSCVISISFLMIISKIAEDQEFTLYAVVVFKRTSADFTQKLRDERFATQLFHSVFTHTSIQVRPQRVCI